MITAQLVINAAQFVINIGLIAAVVYLVKADQAQSRTIELLQKRVK